MNLVEQQLMIGVLENDNFSNATNPNHVYSVEDNDPERAYAVELIAYSEFGCADTATKKTCSTLKI